MALASARCATPIHGDGSGGGYPHQDALRANWLNPLSVRVCAITLTPNQKRPPKSKLRAGIRARGTPSNGRRHAKTITSAKSTAHAPRMTRTPQGAARSTRHQRCSRIPRGATKTYGCHASLLLLEPDAVFTVPSGFEFVGRDPLGVSPGPA